MPKIFIKELDNIKKMILSLGAMVEERVRLAAEAVENKDAEAAQRVIKADYEIDEMMSPGVHAEQLDCSHVGYPRERRPVGFMKREECPFDAVEGKALLDNLILGDVGIVVIGDEVVLKYRREGCRRKDKQEHQKCGILLDFSRKLRGSAHLFSLTHILDSDKPERCVCH